MTGEVSMSRRCPWIYAKRKMVNGTVLWDQLKGEFHIGMIPTGTDSIKTSSQRQALIRTDDLNPIPIRFRPLSEKTRPRDLKMGNCLVANCSGDIISIRSTDRCVNVVSFLLIVRNDGTTYPKAPITSKCIHNIFHCFQLIEGCWSESNGLEQITKLCPTYAFIKWGSRCTWMIDCRTKKRFWKKNREGTN
jgi:hypothetical protein